MVATSPQAMAYKLDGIDQWLEGVTHTENRSESGLLTLPGTLVPATEPADSQVAFEATKPHPSPTSPGSEILRSSCSVHLGTLEGKNA